ncbi:MAG: hypothetical protein JNL82_15290 [Myxococcales bacterium]|nr:hypothetical protein [Myxococcales bacterium]
MTFDPKLLTDRFRSPAGLRRFLVAGPDGDVFRRELPGEIASLEALADAAAALVSRHRLAAETLHARLPRAGLPADLPTFERDRGYDPAFDVRDHAELARLVARPPSHGVLWLLVGARRSGKTWVLKALEHQHGDRAKYVELRRVEQWPPRGKATVLLVDEPQFRAGDGRDPAKFLAGCEVLCKRGVSVVLALTPAERAALQAADVGGRLHEKSLRYISPLTDEEAARMAARTEAASKLFDELPWTWRRSAFLLEWLLATHASGAYADVAALSCRIRELCELERYLHFAFHDSYTAAQRQMVRDIAWGVGRRDPTLLGVGLVGEHDGQMRVADPVVSAAFSPVRIEHLAGPLDPTTLASLVDDMRTRCRQGHGPHLTICAGADDHPGPTTEHPCFARDSPLHIVVGAGGADEVLAYPDANVVVLVLSDTTTRVPELPLADGVRIAVLRSPAMCDRLLASTDLQRSLYRAGVRLVLGPGAPDARLVRLGWFEGPNAVLHLARSPAVSSPLPGSTRVEVRRDRGTAIDESWQRFTIAVQRATFGNGAWTADPPEVLE